MARLTLVCAAAAAILFPGAAVASVTWSSPVVIARGAALTATASDREGQVAAVFGIQGGPKDFGGVSASVGLGLIVVNPVGGVSPPVLLSGSPTAWGADVALAAGHPVVAWLDRAAGGSSPNPLWVWDSWSSGGPVAQELSPDAWAGATPAVATDEHGDVVVAWVDASSREVMASSSVGGGAWGAPAVVSPQETSEFAPVATMDAQGRTTIAWQANGPTGFQPAGTPGPPGVVMAASALRGQPFAAPEAALTGPAGTLVRGLTIESGPFGRVLVSATLAALPTWNDPSGGPAVNYAIATDGGAFSPEGQLTTTPGGIGPWTTEWATAPDGGILAAEAAQTATVSELATTRFATDGATTVQVPYQLPFAPGQLGPVSTVAPGFDSGGDAIVVFSALGTMESHRFGNPTEGTLLSVADPAGSAAWCSAQVVSGLMAPFFPLGAGYDTAGHGVVLYQQSPFGIIGAAYLTPYSGCPPAPGSIPLTLAPVARADRTLHSASIASVCTATQGCAGKLLLLDGRSYTLASGTVATATQRSTPIQLRLTGLGRKTLTKHRRVRTRAELITGRLKRALPPVTLARG